MTFRKQISILLTVSGILFAAILITLIIWHNQLDENQIALELIKTTLQLFLIVILGGVMVRSLDEKRRDEITEKEILQRYLINLNEVYMAVKSARRKLKSRGLTGDHGDPGIISKLQWKCLDEEMQKVNQAQLTIEAMKIEMQQLPEFTSLQKADENLRIMKEYLRKVLWEYEKFMPQLLDGKEVRLEKLSSLLQFTTEKFSATFISQFWKPHEEVIRALGGQISQRL